MAEENDAERSYPATQRRIEQARERGQVARSRELTTAAVSFTAAAALWALGPGLFKHCLSVVQTGLTLDRSSAFEPDRMLSGLQGVSIDVMTSLLPFLGLITLATLAAPLMLSGWIFSTKAVSPDFTRLNPMRGFKNLFSVHSVAELVKAVAKCVLLGGIGAYSVMSTWIEMEHLSSEHLPGATAKMGAVVGDGFFALVGGLVLIALIDVPYQLFNYYKGLRMTREEIRQEQREMEGDPQLKARIRAQQRSVARKRMMAAVPKANVIVTNPTHYAVALEYRENGMRAPRVVAKGMNLIAQRIRAIGEENRIPILEAPPLARALHRHTDIGEEIPQALFTVVAQVLAYVYQVQRYRAQGGPVPVAPRDLDVPADMDPLAGGAGA